MQCIKTTQWVSWDLFCPVASRQVGEEEGFQCDIGKNSATRGSSILTWVMKAAGLLWVSQKEGRGHSVPFCTTSVSLCTLCSLSCEWGKFS